MQAEAVLKSCYTPVGSLFNSATAMMMEIASDLWYNNTSTVDAISSISPSSPGQGSTVWKQCYLGIMRCNECIECIGAATFDESVKASLTAEARVLRAFYYYYLTNVFDGVPFYTCMVADRETQDEIRRLPRTEARTIRATLYDDLEQNALPYLEAVRGSEVKENRAGQALALMLMAKFAMWNEDWDAALVPLEALEALYGPLTEERYPLEETVWWKKDTAESIFEVQHAWSAEGVQYAGTVCNMYYPTYDGEGWYNGVYMPQWGTEISNHSSARATWRFGCFRPASGDKASETTSEKYLEGIFRPLPLTYGPYSEDLGRRTAVLDLAAIRAGTIRGEKIDRRSLYVLGMGDLDTGDTFTEVQKNGRPFAGRKFWVPGRVSSYDSNNYKIFRYADAVQMAAECWCRKGEPEKALAYLNQPRIRAGVDPVEGVTDEEEIMGLIQDERARELGGEMHRRFDLVRWGIWYDAILRYAPANATILTYIKPFHRYYPIPDTECALTGYILTNPDYVGYEN